MLTFLIVFCSDEHYLDYANLLFNWLANLFRWPIVVVEVDDDDGVDIAAKKNAMYSCLRP